MLLIIAKKRDNKIIELFTKAPNSLKREHGLFVIEEVQNHLAGNALCFWRRHYGLAPSQRPPRLQKEPLEIPVEKWIDENANEPRITHPRPRRFTVKYDPTYTGSENAFIEYIWSPFDNTWKYRKI